MENRQQLEFGGPVGSFSLIIFAHILVYYLWISLTLYHGGLVYPHSFTEMGPFFHQISKHIQEYACPTWYSFFIYGGFLLIQFIFATIVPGVWITGMPVSSEQGKCRKYLCNAALSWYATLLIVIILHVSGLFPLTELVDNVGHLLTTVVIFADLFSIALYVIEVQRKKQIRMTGNFVYDFFMGASLNPSIGIVDLKMLLDIRLSWIFLFLLTLSATVKQYELYGFVSLPMITILLAQGLYTNACMKGEECVPTTWDIFYEKCGWMFIFWNAVGVPFFYSFQSQYILINNPEYPLWISILLISILFVAYYIWDTANSQKNRFRMQRNNSYLQRYTFPQFSWGTLKNPRYISTEKGTPLLIDGWYRYARKIHYSADIVMAMIWGLSCGFSGVLPYIYPLFFIIMIIHRYYRDTKRCEKKYGHDWETYCKTVPYKFIPYVW